MAGRIDIESSDHLHDSLRDDLQLLADDLAAQGYEVSLGEKEWKGYRVTWWEAFHFFISEVGRDEIDIAVGVATAAFISWARRRFRERDGRAGDAPKSATIYGPDDKPLRRVEIKKDEDEPTITDY